MLQEGLLLPPLGGLFIAVFKECRLGALLETRRRAAQPCGSAGPLEPCGVCSGEGEVQRDRWRKLWLARQQRLRRLDA